MIWFSSDWHLGHTNIAGPKVSKWPDHYRDFDTVSEMDAYIIDQANSWMNWGDTLYYLGDFCLGSLGQVERYRARVLVEQIHFIRGNHDKWEKKAKTIPFTTIQDVKKITHEGTTIFMSHYGHRVWPHSHKGCIHLYGHSHGSLPSYGRSIDVGIDSAYKVLGEYRPFAFDEIIELIGSNKIEIPDHHGSRLDQE